MRLVFVAAVAAVLLAALPASATPVEYVRVCTSYGAGWSYIPGTDTCVNADTGATKRVIEDNVITDQTTQARNAEQAKQDAEQAKEGVALSLALPRATVTAGHRFAAAANVGVFEGESALGVGAAFQANDNVSFNGNFGVGLQHGTMGGSAGLNVSW